ncbi:MAG: hypothetical protein JNL01_06130 [Bdellovibrionales bacterium]|nr:hypothetical protein [Bdellovibrionales bacterium]
MKSRTGLHAAILLFSAINLASCAQDSTDTLVGTWSIQSIDCNGTPGSLMAGITSFQIVYRKPNSDGTGDFATILSGGTCPSATFLGKYTRKGLTVTENPESLDCGSGCPPINCSPTLISITYDITIPNGTQLFQYNIPSTQNLFCAAGQTEKLTFQKL